MDSDDVATLDVASLDAFRTELVEAGFEPFGGDSRRWVGPITAPLRGLTPAETMRITFQDGWPYRPPLLFVTGIVSEHAVRDGELCLYQPGDESMSWLTFAGFQARIGEWVEQRERGFRPEDAILDAHLFFVTTGAALATLDLSGLKIGPRDRSGRTGELFGTWNGQRSVLRLEPSRPSKGHVVAGRWYYNGKLVAAPPRDLDEFRAALTKGQQTNFDRRLNNIRRGDGPRVLVLLWETRHGGRNALVLSASLDKNDDVAAEALELAPNDPTTLKLRAGPDAPKLGERVVVVIGVGSIGSNVACRLSEAGVGRLRLVDGGTLRPGNVVRHAADYGIGSSKALATTIAVGASAPWTEVEPIAESPWSPARLLALLNGADLVVEATGMARFAELLGRVALDAQVSLVSSALYRCGHVGRVRRQIHESDTPLSERTDEERFPLIPPGHEPIALEAGCSAAVNNASPVAVAAIAATTAEVAIDALTGTSRYGEELIDVYRPLEVEPFDRIGRVRG